jgi:hypothetical protein
MPITLIVDISRGTAPGAGVRGELVAAVDRAALSD